MTTPHGAARRLVVRDPKPRGVERWTSTAGAVWTPMVVVKRPSRGGWSAPHATGRTAQREAAQLGAFVVQELHEAAQRGRR